MSCGTQAKLYGISEARILSLLRSAYSQNIHYLIKKPNNQVPGHRRGSRQRPRGSAKPESAVHQERRRSADGSPPCGDRRQDDLGPQAVNHINQMSPASRSFQSQARVRDRAGDGLVERAAKQMLPGDGARQLPGQALTFRETVRASRS